MRVLGYWIRRALPLPLRKNSFRHCNSQTWVGFLLHHHVQWQEVQNNNRSLVVRSDFQTRTRTLKSHRSQQTLEIVQDSFFLPFNSFEMSRYDMPIFYFLFDSTVRSTNNLKNKDHKNKTNSLSQSKRLQYKHLFF